MNLMSDTSNTVLSRYLQPALARTVAAGGDPAALALDERSDAVVLCADMRGFTQTSQILQPVTVLALLDAFFTGMTEVIEQHGGMLFNIQGDTLQAAFGLPEAQSDPAEQSVQAAQQMQTTYQTLAQEWQDEFGIRTALGIGINRGEVVAGIAGAPQFQNYMVFGDCVEMAVRFMHRARAGEYVFSKAIKQAVESADMDVSVTPLPVLEIAGRDPTPLFGVVLDTRLDFT
jgi:adenylate cyclase